MVDRDRLISALEEAPDRIAELVSGAESEAPAPEGWGRIEVFRHIRASDAILGQRIMQILVRVDPPLPAFDDRAWGDLIAMSGISIEDQLAVFRLGRSQLIGILRSLSEADWLKGGTHEVVGKQSIDEIVKHIADHEAEHIDQLLDL
ncbi:MAG TPA: DinB family protein [Actinomycetota bacterium]|nr:DinB family protein [Actinomycetota bacterium]